MSRVIFSCSITPLVKSFFPKQQPIQVFRRMSAVKTSHLSNEDVRASKLFDVSHVVAVVTGGGTGIGIYSPSEGPCSEVISYRQIYSTDHLQVS